MCLITVSLDTLSGHEDSGLILLKLGVAMQCLIWPLGAHQMLQASIHQFPNQVFFRLTGRSLSNHALSDILQCVAIQHIPFIVATAVGWLTFTIGPFYILWDKLQICYLHFNFLFLNTSIMKYYAAEPWFLHPIDSWQVFSPICLSFYSSENKCKAWLF
jgi:hypothetical protein